MINKNSGFPQKRKPGICQRGPKIYNAPTFEKSPTTTFLKIEKFHNHRN